MRLLARERGRWWDDPWWEFVRGIAYVIWAITSFAWLCGIGGWVLEKEGPGPGHSITFLVGTIWAGGFFIHVLNRKT